MNHPFAIPRDAKPFAVIVEPDPSSPIARKGWDIWKASIIAEMEAEGIIVTNVEGLSHFSGYYFPDKITPRMWLKDEARKQSS